jgi:hypothetical protein
MSQKPLVIETRSKNADEPALNALLSNDPEILPDDKPHALDDTLADELFAMFRHATTHLAPAMINKTTMSTQVAMRDAPKTTIDHIPAQFKRYAKVFSEEASHRLPKHQPWDHAIDLKPDATMKNSGIYRLTPKEQEAQKEYITEHLQKGYIRPSKSPMASSFFFVDKKDGKLRPVQDYRRLNDITVKNAAPLPLIPELIDKLTGARYFTKLDVRWGYNNIRIKQGDEWKAAFKTSLGLFEPLVMTFGLCNAPATFQSFMNQIFEDLVDEGNVVVYLDDILIFHDILSTLTKLTHDVLRHWQGLGLPERD